MRKENKIQEETRLPNRFAPLDGLRGIAVLMVFLSHTSGRDMAIHDQLNFKGIGHIGVYLFFCLSAYLLGSRLLMGQIDKQTIKKFFIKRIFRIWPLYFTVLIIVLIMQYGFGYFNSDYLFITKGWLPAMQHFIFYRGDGVFWSVVAEEQFYIIVPFLLLAYQKWPKMVALICLGIVTVNFILYLSKHIGFPIETNYLKYISTNARENGNYLDVFLGSFLLLFGSKLYPELVKRNAFHLISTFLFVIFLTASLVLVSENFLAFHRPAYWFKYLTLAFVIGFMPFIISLENGNKYVAILEIPLLRKVGLYGFSFYLLHFLLFDFINSNINVDPWMKFCIAFVSVYFVSKLFYLVVEKPFIELGYSLSNSLRNSADKK